MMALSQKFVLIIGASAGLIVVPNSAMAELRATAWPGYEIGECLSRNFIRVSGEQICIREVKGKELEAYYRQRRFTALRRRVKEADDKYKQYDRLVERGYDPDVSLGEFRRRLNKRTEAFDEKLDAKQDLRDMNY